MCGYRWQDGDNTELHETHVCGLLTNGGQHTHDCIVSVCRGTQ
jgi:hypothetical protein